MTLHDMINSKGFEMFISDRLGNDLFINDPDRAERLHDAAEEGCDGSYHSERIDDQRDYLKSLDIIDPEYPEDGGDITQADYDAISKELDEVELWHEKNGSLYQEVG
jgi:hypothetical protein